MFSLSLIFLNLIYANFVLAQQPEKRFQKELVLDSILPHYDIRFQIQASLLRNANIINLQGKYSLQSRQQSAYSAGLHYQLNLDSSLNIEYGFEVNFTSSNYYLHIPDSELPGFLSTSGAPQIEDKQVYYRIAIPVSLSRKIAHTKQGFYSLQAGIKFNYSGFSNDETTSVQLGDSSFQLTTIFRGEFQSNNNKKPWITFFGAISKNFYLRNRGLLALGLSLELSRTKFIKGSYQIIIPNQLESIGEYSVTGSGIGLSMQYIFPKKGKKYLRI